MQPFPGYLGCLFFPSDTRASNSALIRMTSIGASRLTHIHETLSLSRPPPPLRAPDARTRRARTQGKCSKFRCRVESQFDHLRALV